MKIELGALSDPISEQLKDLGISKEDLRHYDLDADAITRANVRGYISDSNAHIARKRLLKKNSENTFKNKRNISLIQR